MSRDEHVFERLIADISGRFLHSGQLVVGSIGVDSVQRIRTWTDDELRRVRPVGDVIANAILRQQKDLEIVINIERGSHEPPMQTRNA